MDPLVAGIALLASVAAFPIMSAPAGRLADKFGVRKPLLIGMGMAAMAMFWIGFAVTRNSYIFLLPGLIGWGGAMPFCYSPTLKAMSNAVPMEKQGQTSGIGVTARLLGGTLGMAICSTLLAITDSFQSVFLVTGTIMLITLLFGFFNIEQ